ncbi:glycine betaine/L-proline ABC transporter ATP-binding protein [Salinivibrio sp. ML198]|uniref:quaternary amine ABC transporter ATP-binding protein n=1 Tax=Salinivibrio sp. ML198 TaxID=1909458 RepID=UPI00098904B6|nr:glycine betaine/L-proline ABC transporter ATP-binding protein [Salinivibrio sp. ML198]OOE79617.1 glycine betaine/L-proline ABC transporter ATP-binding protein [Salinivibrio sp. ML198]
MTKPVQDTLIEIQGLYKVFGDHPQKVMPAVKAGKSKDALLQETGHTIGLSDINLSIRRGEVFVIMGLSGSGKSTLIRHFNRLIDPTEGEIRVEGTDIMKHSQKELQAFRRHKMSMVFQRFGLLPHRTVRENVGFGLRIQGEGKAQRDQKAEQWLSTVGLDGYADQYPAQLSGGQQQRVGLARALCTDAEILLMDEAFSALDPLIRSEMQDQLIELQEKLHKTIIFITHDLDEALRLGDRIAILRDGKLVQVGEPVDILLQPADDYVEAFVKDVNRARALTVETVMQPQICRISANTIGDAIQQMRQQKANYGYYITEEGYQGTLSQKNLSDKDPSGDIEASLLEDVPAIEQDSLLETVIPDTLESKWPLPVFDNQGELIGHLSRQTVASILSESGHKHAGAPDDKDSTKKAS